MDQAMIDAMAKAIREDIDSDLRSLATRLDGVEERLEFTREDVADLIESCACGYREDVEVASIPDATGCSCCE